jgi:hypothetical protein
MMAFSECTSLRNLRLPASLESVDSWAFYACSSLTSLQFPASVTTLEDGAFYACPSLTRATFEGDAPSLGSDNFDGAAPDFCIYFHNDASGFTSPTWEGYPAQAYSSSGPDWSDSLDFENAPGWFNSTWYAWFYAKADWQDWIYHENHGWQYVYDICNHGDITIYDSATNAWWFTGADCYTFMYNYANSAWYYYIEGTTPSRKFYDYASSSVIDEAAVQR